MNIVFEEIKDRHKYSINKYLKRGNAVYIIEPFHAYHHRKGLRFFPPPLPDFVENLIKERKINLLRVSQLNAKDIYHLTTDKAVEVIESVFLEYRKEHMEFIEYVSDTLKSPFAENIFKKSLCNRLAEFYSMNIMLSRIEKTLELGPILVYPDMNVRSYSYLKNLLLRSNKEVLEHPNIRFPIRTHVTAVFENLGEYLIAMAKLTAQTLVSGFISSIRISQEKEKKSYSYGMTIVAPLRQLTSNQRGPDFIVDNDKIRTEDVVYIPLADLTSVQEKRLAEMPGEIYYPPKASRCFSHFTEWRKLLGMASRKYFLRNSEEIDEACRAFINYFRWLKVLKDIKLCNFITHCDFGESSIARNLALNQAGIKTWYYTDSSNSGCNMKGVKKGNGVRHPFWTYLYYDHLVTWNELLVQYYKTHPGSFKQNHVVGCLWSEHVKKQCKVANTIVFDTLKNLKGKFKVAVFDTSYSRNGWTSYAEGILFAKHFLQLVDEESDIFIFLKEKKPRNIHHFSDQVLGPKLLDLYDKMDTHSRITTYSDNADSSELISSSDMVASFPFTSTTFEALSANKLAIWHDPMGYYRNTPYGKVGGVMTHNYEELKAKVLEFKKIKPGTCQNPIPKNSPLMDPYMDGKALDRFRELLQSAVC